MFDYYEPAQTVACEVCGAAVATWQGKDGPCAMLVWREGAAHAVGQRVDDDATLSPTALGSFVLPPWFALTGWCKNEHPVDAAGSCTDGIWTSTTISG